MHHETIFTIFSFFFGAIFGSFNNVCIHRLPKGESIVFPPSRCPYCKTKIAFYDNIPLISWIILRAKCRHCGIFIPFRYFLVELLTGVASLMLFLKYDFSTLFFIYFAFVCSLIIISFIDFEHRIIPNSISIPGAILGLFFAFVFSHSSIPWEVTLRESIVGLLIGGGALLVVGWGYSFLTGRDGIGFGDVKLLAMFGAFFGWKGAFFSILLGSTLGFTVSLPVIIAKRKNLKYPIPFGPFLAMGLVIYFWFAKNFFDKFFHG